jgi:hypothetical protein
MQRCVLRARPQVLLAMAVLVLSTGMAAGGGLADDAAEAAASRRPILPSTEPPTTQPPAPEPPPAEAPAAPPAEAAPAAAVAPAEAAPAPPPAPPPQSWLPVGKGMWLHQLSQAAGGNAERVVAHARKVGLTHVYLRLGSSKKGFYAQDELDRLLPVAHANGIKVVGWDFPYLFDPIADAVRAKAEIDYVTPTGHRIDSFSADIETAAEGVNLTAEGALAYGAKLRELVGAEYPLIACVPRPSPKRWFPFAEAVAHFDAIAPMVYWQNRDPATDVAQALADLAPFNKPVIPVGQAYDGQAEGGPAGPPPKDHLDRFMNTALANGALGVSFWVWHHATAEHWAAIDQALAWELPASDPPNGGRVRFLQRVLTLFGQQVAQDGMLGPQTRSALANVQLALGLPATGQLDQPTVSSLVGPRV